ncbi:hypothetical protein D3C75_736590 [compost metagenome]
MGEVGQQQHELVAAEAGEGVARADLRAHALGDLHQHLVADRVAQGVVDRLEAIEVDQHDRQFPRIAPGDLAALQQAVFQQRTIGQAGEHVVASVVGQFGLEALALGNVVLHADVVGDHAALVRHRSDVQVVPEGAAILAEVAQHHMGLALFGQTATDFGDARLVGLAALEEAAVAAEYFFLAKAGDALEGLVGVDDRLIRNACIDDQHAVVAGFQAALQQGGAGVAVVQPFVCAGALQGVANAASEQATVELALDQIVRGTQVEGAGVEIAVVLAGEEDQRMLDAAGAGMAHQLQAGVGAQPVVDQVQVVGIAVDGVEAAFEAVHPVQHVVQVAGLAQQIADDQEVVLVILDQQQAQWVLGQAHERGGSDGHSMVSRQ